MPLNLSFRATGPSVPDQMRATSESHGPTGAAGGGEPPSRNFLEILWQDIRYGLRTFGRSPGFTAVAVVILALGIGANTTMFTIVNSLFLRQPPLVAAPHELVAFTRVSENGSARNSMMYPDYEYYRENNEVFSGLATYRFSGTAMAVGDGDRIVQARAGFVSDNYFDVLDVPMAQGRSFLPEENQIPGTHPVAILGNGFWKRSFGSEPGIVGRDLLLNGNSYTVVGIAPEGFRGVSPVEEPPDILLPAMMRGFGLRRVDGQFSYSWNIVGRLRPGVDLAAAQANIGVVQGRFADEFATWIAATSPPRSRMVLTSRYQLSPRDGDELGRLMFLLSLVVGTVLLIACANVALLMLARASARRCEIGIRCALGAGRWRVTRQLFTESMLLAVAGGLGGFCIAFWGAEFAASLIPFSFNLDFTPDGPVIMLTLVLSAGAAVLFGLAPAIQSSSQDIASLLRHGRQHGRRSTLRDALVVAQMAISIVLVTGAGLFVRSLLSAQGVELGFDADRKLLISLPLSNAGYDREDGKQFIREMSDRIASLPEVTGISTTLVSPFEGRWSEDIRVPTTQFAAVDLEVGFNTVGPGYFSVIGIPLADGREFTAADDEAAPAAVIVNETTAALLWPGQNAVDKSITWNERDWTVIGVARDALYYEVGEAPQTQIYFSAGQNLSLIPTFVIASTGRLWDVARLVEETVRAHDQRIVIHSVTTLADVVREQSGQYRVSALLIAMFGGLALLLAAVGLYGVMAYLVGQRTREIGIRMALGATKGTVARAVIGRGVFLALIGNALGLGAAFASARMVESMLFGIRARDPITFVSAPLILLGVTIVASFVPAVRASRVDPVEALTEE